MNTILTKSAKKMFSGVRGGVVCCLAFFLAFAVFGLDMIGLDTYVPSASSVRSVSVRVSNVGYYELKFENEEDIARITEIVDQYLSDKNAAAKEREEYVTVAETKMKYGDLTQKEEFEQDLLRQTAYMMNDSMYVRVSFRTVGGMRFDKNYDAVINGAHFELLTMMANHEDFPEVYFGDDDTYIDGAWIDIARVDFPSEEFYGLKYKYKSDEARAIWERMHSSYNGVEWFNRPGLASININDAPNFEYPYYDGTDAAVDIYAETVDSIQVVNAKTGAIREYTNPAEIRQILAAGVRYYSRVSSYTPKDDTYVFFVQLEDEKWQYSFSAYFLKDHLPPIALP